MLNKAFFSIKLFSALVLIILAIKKLFQLVSSAHFCSSLSLCISLYWYFISASQITNLVC